RGPDIPYHAFDANFPGHSPDRAGERARLGKDFRAAHRNVIAAAGRDVSHAGDDRLFGLDPRDLAPHQVAGNRRAARAVNPEHDAHNLRVFFPLAKRLDDGVAADRLAGQPRFAFAAIDFADRVDDGDFLARTGLSSRFCSREQLEHLHEPGETGKLLLVQLFLAVVVHHSDAIDVLLPR